MVEKDYIIIFRNRLSISHRPSTVDCYVNIVKRYLDYFKKHPKQITEDEAINYILRYENCSTKTQLIGALRLFYKLVIGQKYKFKHIEPPRKESKLPEILSLDEIQRLTNIIKYQKHKAVFALLYSCGIRVSELINLKPADIDSNRMEVHIRNGKGGKDRKVALFPNTLERLRIYYKTFKPKEYLFNGQKGLPQYSGSSIQQFLKKYCFMAGITKNIHPHSLRHSYAVHLLESGVSIRKIQELLGHSRITTTERYTHVANLNMNLKGTPIENLNL
jgi:site-specific recombinase XerD